jgi:hypothetical protein
VLELPNWPKLGKWLLLDVTEALFPVPCKTGLDVVEAEADVVTEEELEVLDDLDTVELVVLDVDDEVVRTSSSPSW